MWLWVLRLAALGWLFLACLVLLSLALAWTAVLLVFSADGHIPEPKQGRCSEDIQYWP